MQKQIVKQINKETNRILTLSKKTEIFIYLTLTTTGTVSFMYAFLAATHVIQV